jgi:hypothetical protein
MAESKLNADVRGDGNAPLPTIRVEANIGSLPEGSAAHVHSLTCQLRHTAEALIMLRGQQDCKRILNSACSPNSHQTCLSTFARQRLAKKKV